MYLLLEETKESSLFHCPRLMKQRGSGHSQGSSVSAVRRSWSEELSYQKGICEEIRTAGAAPKS